MWAANGTELFYQRGPRIVGFPRPVLAGVRIIGTHPFEWTSETLLTASRFVTFLGAARHYDITPDGKRFLMIFQETRTAGETQINRPEIEPSHIRIVLNWFTELQRRVPVK